MKTCKRLMALVLMLCMLCGLPIVLNLTVSAADPFQLRFATAMIPGQNIANADDYATSILLTFNCIPYNKGAAGYVVILDNMTDCNIIQSWTTGADYMNYPGGLRFYLTEEKEYNGQKIGTIQGILDAAAATGKVAAFGLIDSSDQPQDGYVNNYYRYPTDGSNLEDCLKADHVFAGCDIAYCPILPAYTLDYALITGNNSLALQTGAPIGNDGRYAAKVRIMDGSTVLSEHDTGWFNYNGSYLVANFPTGFDLVETRLAELKAEHPDARMMFYIQEINNNAQKDEWSGNGFVDTLWNSVNGVKLAANAQSANKDADAALVPLVRYEELDGLRITGATAYGSALKIDFNKPFVKTAPGSWDSIRIYKVDQYGNRTLEKKDGAWLQWQVKTDNYYAGQTEGLSLIGQIQSNFGTNTYEGILAFANANGYTADNGYEVVFSIEEAGGVENTGVVESYRTREGNEPLIGNIIGGCDHANTVITVSDEDALISTGVTVYNDRSFVISFNKEVSFDNAGHVIFLRIVDANGNLIWRKDDGSYTPVEAQGQTPLQWGLDNNLNYYMGKTQLISSLGGSELYSNALNAYNGMKDSYPGARLALVIEENNQGEGFVASDNKVNSIYAITDSGKLGLTAQLTQGVDRFIWSINEGGASITVEKAEVVAANKLRVTFSAPVVNNLYNPQKGGGIFVRYTDADKQSVIFKHYSKDGSEDIYNTSESGFNNFFHWTGAFAPVEGSNNTIWEFTLESGLGMDDFRNIYTMTKTGYFKDKDWKLCFGIEQQLYDGEGNVKDAIDNFTSPDGSSYLVSTNANGWDNYTEITFSEEYPAPATAPRLVSVKPLSDTELVATFSEPMNDALLNCYSAIRVIDKTYGWLAWSGAPDVSTPYQITCQKKWYNTECTQVKYKLSGEAILGANTLSKLQKLQEAGGAFADTDRYEIVLYIEENTLSAENGVIDHVKGLNSGLNLVANYHDTRRDYGPDFNEGAGMAWEPYEAPSMVKLNSVTQINGRQIELVFSDGVKIIDNEDKRGGKFMFTAVRLVSSGNVLIFAHNNEDGSYYFDTTESSGAVPMQWSGSLEYSSYDHTKMIFTPDTRMSEIVAKVESERTKLEESFGAGGYKLVFAMEEGCPENPAPTQPFEAANGGIHQVRAYDDVAKQLEANVPGANGGIDRLYVSIDQAADNGPVYLVGVRLTGATEAILTFSEDVEYDASKIGYYGVRYLSNEDLHLFAGENNAWYAQWHGSIAGYNGGNKNQLVFKLNGNGNFPTSTFYDIITFANADAKAALENLNGTFYIGMEEGASADHLNGMMDGIYALGDPTRMLASKPEGACNSSPGAWNGTWIKLPTDIPHGALNITDVKAVDRTHIVVTFDQPVKVDKILPYSAVRMVNAENQLLFAHNGLTTFNTTESGSNCAMQWTCTLDPANPHGTYGENRLVFTLTDGAHFGVQTLDGIVNKDWAALSPDLANVNFVFGIEEIAGCEGFAGNNGKVDNILMKDAPGEHLTANITAGLDKCYNRFTIAYNPGEVGGTLSATASVYNSTQVLVQFSEAVQINGNPFIAIRMTDPTGLHSTGSNSEAGELAWTGVVPLQFYGSWKWFDEEHTAILWTYNGANTYGAHNLEELYSYANGLMMFSDWGLEIKFCIEEAGAGFVGYDYLVENVVSLDGQRRLEANLSIGADHAYLDIDTSRLVMGGDPVSVEYAKVISDTELEVKFTEPVIIASGAAAPVMNIRYLSETGAAQYLATGQTAVFAGDWEWVDDTHTVLRWKLDLNSSRVRDFDVKSINDLLNFKGDLSANKKDTVAFVIVESEEGSAGAFTMQVGGVTDLNGIRRLKATRLAAQNMFQIAITGGTKDSGGAKVITKTQTVTRKTTVVPEPTVIENTTTETETIRKTITYPDYLLTAIIGGGVLLLGLIAAIVIFIVRKKKNAKQKA